jgi:nucleoporin SEH1
MNDHHSSKVLVSNHMDYIHHISFDVYGRRLATCSGDRFVRVWDLTDTGDWNLVGEWQAHRGNVTKVAWAHPEFGSVLATSGSDSDAKIWEERTHGHAQPHFVVSATSTQSASSPAANLSTIGSAGSGVTATAVAGASTNAAASLSLSSRWTIKTQLTEARKAVSCLEFAPRHWGLKLATGSADGCVRIYEAVDVMNLSQWPLAATLQAFGQGEGTESSSSMATDQLGVSCLSWCTGRFEPPTLVVGGSHLSIFRYVESARSWQPLLQLPSTGNNLHVLDVAWAPNVGRRFHYIAAAEDQQLRLYKLSRTYADVDENTAGKGVNNKQTAKKPTGINNNKLEVQSAQTLVANAWRCQWNVTGTVLASSGDAG